LAIYEAFPDLGHDDHTPGGTRHMIRPPTHLKTMNEKRAWLERELPIPRDMRRSPAYRTLSDESKIILMLMMAERQGGDHASS